MLYEIIRKIYTTHGTKTLLAYLIRDVNDVKYLGIICHGRLEGYVLLDDVTNAKMS